MERIRGEKKERLSFEAEATTGRNGVKDQKRPIRRQNKSSRFYVNKLARYYVNSWVTVLEVSEMRP